MMKTTFAVAGVCLAGALVLAQGQQPAPATPTATTGETLPSLYQSERSTDVKETILQTLGDRGATATLVSLYDSEKDQDLRETILRQLAHRDDQTARAKLAAVAESDPNAELRETAIRQIADHGQTTVLAALYDAERDPDVLETILRCIADRDDEAGRAKVLAVAKGDGDEEVRETAIVSSRIAAGSPSSSRSTTGRKRPSSRK